MKNKQFNLGVNGFNFPTPSLIYKLTELISPVERVLSASFSRLAQWGESVLSKLYQKRVKSNK